MNFDYMGGMVPAALLAFIAAMLIVAIIIGVALYVYFALALSAIAKKMKYKKHWLAWIPVANGAMLLQLGGFHWAWIFLILIPILGWIALAVLTVISYWRIFEKLKYAGAWSLVIVGMAIPGVSWIFGIGFLVLLGIVAWKK